MPCGGRTKANRVKKRVTRCRGCGKIVTGAKHKHKMWNYGTGTRMGPLRVSGTYTRTEYTYICPRVEATKLLKALMDGAKSDLPKEVLIERQKVKCQCGCGRSKIVVTHKHEEKVPA